MARPPDDSFAVPARHKETSPLSVKMTLRCFFMFRREACFADGGLSLSVRKKFRWFAAVSSEPQPPALQFQSPILVISRSNANWNCCTSAADGL